MPCFTLFYDKFQHSGRALCDRLSTGILCIGLISASFADCCLSLGSMRTMTCAVQVSYMILQRVTPVTHSVGNCLKRVIVIVASVIVFQNPMSQKNMIGMLYPVSFSRCSSASSLSLYLWQCSNHTYMIYSIARAAYLGTTVSCGKCFMLSRRHWHLIGGRIYLQPSQEDVWQEEGCSCMRQQQSL